LLLFPDDGLYGGHFYFLGANACRRQEQLLGHHGMTVGHDGFIIQDPAISAR
jgi:hypothetical protein